MGGKRFSRRHQKKNFLVIGIGMMVFLSGCNGIRSPVFQKEPVYVADFQHLERVLNYIDQRKFKSALAENVKLESHYDYSTNRSCDYDRVIRVYARMNSSLLKKVIRDEKNLFQLSKKVQEKDVMMKKLNFEMDKLSWKLQSITLLLKTVEHLDTENKILRQQIKDFKKIDLEGSKINMDIQK
jgi:predicted RNase H-like nuclease (RuvC/YqgF family)